MSDTSLPQQFADSMGALTGPDFPTDLAVAVSGGGDSMAMLHLAAGWARIYGTRLWPVTVDHGLRPEGAAEAEMVAAECNLLGLPHSTLRWEGWDGTGNLQDAARTARRDLIGRWRGICSHVLFAHTQDDQAETFLLRLARGSGVDGLAAMRATARVAAGPLPPLAVPGGPPGFASGPPDWTILRPLLDVSRADLRHYATVLRIPFVDDPSNADPRFDRVRVRALLDPLEAEGLTRARLSETAARMARARVALGRRAHDVARDLLRPGLYGNVTLDRDGFATVEAETRLRIAAAALQHVASAPYRPREAALEAALDRWLAGGQGTLHGCLLIADGARLIVAREPAAAAAPVPVGVLWDGRWLTNGPDMQGLTQHFLGENGLTQVGGPRNYPRNHPRAACPGLPAIWQGDRLFACQALDFGPLHVLEHRPPGGDFPKRLLSD